jgi:ubiquinone/menaquinone biosynthesis C-methylase UbiE
VNRKHVVKTQFNEQAEEFSSWVWTKDKAALQQLFDFIGISQDDELLDVACGSGEFTMFCAKRIRRARGTDISTKMIELAAKLAAANQLDNLSFDCCDVEKLPFQNGSFSVVTSKSAFHHMENYPKVFNEMVRCCKGKGLLCVDDLTTYDDPHVNAFFDEFDRVIDVSHNARVAEDALRDLFAKNGVEILKATALEFEMSTQLYASHAVQPEEAKRRMGDLLREGLKDPQVSGFLYRKNDKTVFKNRAFRVVGRKTRA